MLESPLKAYVLFGGVEPEADSLVRNAGQALAGAEFVVALTPYAPEAIRDVAQVLLPIGTFAETSGTFVNIEGRWQSFTGVAHPVGEARPGWKVLRVVGTLLNLPGFEFNSSEEVRDAARHAAGHAGPGDGYTGTRAVVAGSAGTVDVPMYQIDAVVRRAPALQQTRDGGQAAVVY
jgi:NADH-quinone oxidoreductase subunit G